MTTTNAPAYDSFQNAMKAGENQTEPGCLMEVKIRVWVDQLARIWGQHNREKRTTSTRHWRSSERAYWILGQVLIYKCEREKTIQGQRVGWRATQMYKTGGQTIPFITFGYKVEASEMYHLTCSWKIYANQKAIK